MTKKVGPQTKDAQNDEIPFIYETTIKLDIILDEQISINTASSTRDLHKLNPKVLSQGCP